MSEPRIIYTAILNKNTLLAEYYDFQGEIISYIKERVLPAAQQVGKK